ncbi:MAG: hypothetical protein Q8O62_10015 [Aequorivita sp.]|nr:hypothetical protein [Aequorivita sp.]
MEETKELPFCISEAKKEKGRYCCAYACSNDAVARKGGLCHKHYRLKRKNIDPVYDRYNLWKCSATQRGKSFVVSLEEFRDFCIETGYILKKGMRGKNATLDRDDVLEGYLMQNITIMTLRANVKKWHTEDKKRIEERAECPF